MVVQWTADSKNRTTIYPSAMKGYTQSTKHDVVKRALDTADASGAQVYVGLQINDDWWTKYLGDAAWLKGEAATANLLADDLWKKYGGHASFVGWYLAFEVDNVETTQGEWENLVAFYATVGEHLKKLGPGKPILISPFFTQDGMSPADWQMMWEYVLTRSPIDILALQDGVGVGHALNRDLPTWFGAVESAIQNARPGMQFWVDTETFNRSSHPMPIHAMANDMCAVQPYVSSYLSFSFNHYLSPQQVNAVYYQTYLDYLAKGKVESVDPAKPGKLTGKATSNSVKLSWMASTDNIGIAGYKVFRNEKQIATLYSGGTKYEDTNLAAGVSYAYKVIAFDAAGNQSPPSDTALVATPQPHLYPVNLSLGKPYSATMAADASYPDAGGVELTDGILDGANYADPAWQGRATTKRYLFTIDLGAVQEIKEVRSEWLQDIGSAVLPPKEVNCAVSDDGGNFVSVGEIPRPVLGDENQSVWYTVTDLSGVSGRFVQMEVIPGSNAGWTFLDEIEVRH